jgi:peroxiredoxin
MKNNKTNAIINGKFLKVGDKVGEFKIEKISANSVNLTSTGTNMTLSLFTDVLMKSK